MSFEANPTLVRASTVLLTGSLLLSGCAGQSENPNLAESSNTFEQTCVDKNMRELPTAANVDTLKDTRNGSIYACEYLMDERVPFNKEAKLYKVTNETYDSQEYTKQGQLGGWVLLAIGAVSGEVSESGKTERKRVSIIRFKDSDDNIQMAILDTERVKVKECADETCTPTVQFNIPKSPLWHKQTKTMGQSADESSIWYSSGSGTRTEVVKNLSLADELNYKDEPIYGGGPDKIGQVISSLSNSVVITLPPSAVQ
jgi:hypothetical protein